MLHYTRCRYDVIPQARVLNINQIDLSVFMSSVRYKLITQINLLSLECIENLSWFCNVRLLFSDSWYNSAWRAFPPSCISHWPCTYGVFWHRSVWNLTKTYHLWMSDIWFVFFADALQWSDCGLKYLFACCLTPNAIQWSIVWARLTTSPIWSPLTDSIGWWGHILSRYPHVVGIVSSWRMTNNETQSER